MKKIVIFSLCFLNFFFSFVLIHADTFSLTEDYIDSEVFVATLLAIEELPLSNNELYTIHYNESSVLGFLWDDVLWDDHVSTIDGRYRRIAGVNDRVKVPAHSKIGVYALIKNEAGHEVTFRDWMFFISRDNTSSNGFTNFGIEAEKKLERYLFMGYEGRKRGYFVPSPLIVDVDDNETKLVKLTSLEISQPLEIKYFEWTPNILENGDLVVDFVLQLKNNAKYTIGNVEYSHGDFFLKRNFSSENEYTYEYQVNYGKDYVAGLNLLDSFVIKKASTKSDCLVSGTTDFFDISGDRKTLVYERSDLNDEEEWFGKSVDLDWYPNQEGMCIELMVYELVGKKLEYSIPLDVDVNFVGSGGILKLGEDLILNVKAKNNGLDLDTLGINLHFDKDFQLIKDSSCNISVVEEGILWNIQDFKASDELNCTIVFEIANKNSFLNLENSLIVNGSVQDNLVFKFIPDLEFSFEYDFLTAEFVFKSNFESLQDVVFLDDFLCKKVFFFDLEDEICI